MLTAVYDAKLGGWQPPEIVPFGDLRISPAASVLHYGMGCFEGMKAYRALKNSEEGGEEDLRLFRPDRNMRRLGDSMARLGMPGHDFDGGEAIECIKELVRLGE
jgi:branched-chain amino acid aminotransferase